MHVMQHLDLLLQHPDETLEKYACKMKHTIATCVYSRDETFENICLKHPKHLKHGITGEREAGASRFWLLAWEPTASGDARACWQSLMIKFDRQLLSKTGEINNLLTHAFTIDIVPLVLEKTCFARHTFKYKWKINKTKQKAQSKKRNAEMRKGNT
jgi:hypothetical protein